jgi:hypothetical protein
MHTFLYENIIINRKAHIFNFTLHMIGVYLPSVMNTCTYEDFLALLSCPKFTRQLGCLAAAANKQHAVSGLVVYGREKFVTLSTLQTHRLVDDERPGTAITDLLLGDQLRSQGKLREDIRMVVTAQPGEHKPSPTTDDQEFLRKISGHDRMPGVIGGILTKRIITGVEGMEPFDSYALGLYTSRTALGGDPTKPVVPIAYYPSGLSGVGHVENGRLSRLFTA